MNIPKADSIGVLSSDDDEDRFELACAELANKNVRTILKEISLGNCTSSGIASKTGLTRQDVILHLQRLERIGLIDQPEHKEGFLHELRGRRAKEYRISQIALLLVPSEINLGTMADKDQNRNEIKRESLELLRRKQGLLLSLLITVGMSTVLFAFSYLWLLRVLGTVTISTPQGFNMYQHLPAFALAILIGLICASSIFYATRRLRKQ